MLQVLISFRTKHHKKKDLHVWKSFLMPWDNLCNSRRFAVDVANENL